MAKRLVARIRELREARGFTQETFAERADLKYKHYQSVEAGRKLNLQLFTLIKIAKGLGLDLKELLDFEAALPIAAEDQGAYETRTTPSRVARKPLKARSGKKRA